MCIWVCASVFRGIFPTGMRKTFASKKKKTNSTKSGNSNISINHLPPEVQGRKKKYIKVLQKLGKFLTLPVFCSAGQSRCIFFSSRAPNIRDRSRSSAQSWKNYPNPVYKRPRSISRSDTFSLPLRPALISLTEMCHNGNVKSENRITLSWTHLKLKTTTRSRPEESSALYRFNSSHIPCDMLRILLCHTWRSSDCIVERSNGGVNLEGVIVESLWKAEHVKTSWQF